MNVCVSGRTYVLSSFFTTVVTANGSAYFGQTGMIDAGGRVGDGQDGQIQFDRLEFESPEDLMRHLYYTCMRSNTSEPPWTTDGKFVVAPMMAGGSLTKSLSSYLW